MDQGIFYFRGGTWRMTHQATPRRPRGVHGTAGWKPQILVMHVTATPGDNEIMLGWAAVGEHPLGIVETSGQYLYFGGRNDPLGQLAVALSADGLPRLTRCCTGCGVGHHGG